MRLGSGLVPCSCRLTFRLLHSSLGLLLGAGVALYLWQRQRRSDGEAVAAGLVLAAACANKDGNRSDDLESGIRWGDMGPDTGDRPSAALHQPPSSAAASADATAPGSGRVSKAGGASKPRRGSSTDAGTLNSSCPITDCTTRGSGGLRGSDPVSADVPRPGEAVSNVVAALGLGGSTSGEVAAAIAAAGIRSGDWRAAVAAVAAKGQQQQQQQQQQQLAQMGPLDDSVGSVGSGMLVLVGASSSRVAALGGGGGSRAFGDVPTAAATSINPLFSLPEWEQGVGSGDTPGTPVAQTPTAAAAVAAAAAAAAATGAQDAAVELAAAGAGQSHTGVVLTSTKAVAAEAAVSPTAGSAGGPAGGSMQQSGSFKLLPRLRFLFHRVGSRTPTMLGGTNTSGAPHAARARSATLSGTGGSTGSGGAGGGSRRAGAPPGTARTASTGMHMLAGMLKGLRLGQGMTSDGANTGGNSGTAGGTDGPASAAAARDVLHPPTQLSLRLSLASGDVHTLAAAPGSNTSAGVTGRPSFSDVSTFAAMRMSCTWDWFCECRAPMASCVGTLRCPACC